jgi:long-chain fatty acid transport protein
MTNRHFWSGALLLGAVTCVSPPARAAGFSLLEQSGSGIGYAFAGAAASADDASAMFFNPAALSLLESPQVAVAVHAVNLETKFSDTGSTLPLAGLGLLPRGATSDNAGDLIPIPNAYFAWPVNDRLAFGFGINAPFGLKTDYVDPWVGRFQGLRSELKTINANPALSWKVSDNLALGIGVNYQYAEAELTNAVLLAPATEGRAGIDVDDDAWGWNAGAIFTLPSATRIGLSYRSHLDYSLSGNTTVTTLGGLPLAAVSGPTTVDITFPDSASLSLVQPVGEGVEIRADASWMNWSEVDTVVAVNPSTGAPRDVLHFAFDDTMRYSLGVDYRYNEQWTFRAGTAFDESPVKNDVRTVRLPDTDRWWLTVGARWRPSENLLVDAGYAHIFVDDANIALTREQTGLPPAFSSTVIGEYDSSVDILSVQATWTFR